MKQLMGALEYCVTWANRRPGFAWLCFFVLALLPRVLAPSGVFINFDAAGKWIIRTKGFMDGLSTFDLSLLVQAPHPGVTLMWLMSVGEWMNQSFHLYRLWADPAIGYITILKLPLLITTSALAATLFLFLRGLTTTRFALAVTLLWSFEPIYLVFSRYMHLDGLLTGLFLLITIALWRARRESSWRWSITAAFLMAVAALTRINIIPALIFTALFASVARRGAWRRWLIQLGGMLGIVVATLIVLWPALVGAWTEVVAIIQRGIKLGTTEHEVPSRVDQHAIVRRMIYPIFLAIRSWTWLIVYAIAGAVVYPLVSIRQRTLRHKFQLYLLAASGSVLIVLFFADKKLDRYAAPAIGPLLLIAMFMFTALWQRLSLNGRRIAGVAMGALMLVSTLDVLRLAPYYQTFQNEIGLLLKRSDTIATSAAFSPAWGEGYYETAKYLESLGWPKAAVRNARTLCVHRTPDDPKLYPFNPAPKGGCSRPLYDLTESVKAEYLAISSATFAQNVYPRLLRDIKRLGWKPVHTIYLNHQPTVYIYRNTGGLRGNYYR